MSWGIYSFNQCIGLWLLNGFKNYIVLTLSKQSYYNKSGEYCYT